MTHRPLIVLADDLTGAAEIAAIAHTAGLRAVVHTNLPARSGRADVLVFDTDTRLLPPAQAARRVRAIVTKLKRRPHAGFFKKVDSVLRGPVLAETEACAAALGRRRILLVSCNPSLGRSIRDGRYFIAGKPLDQTVFARDPHHPRMTADVLALLGPDGATAPVCLPPASRLPRAGVVVGEADSPADVTVWAGQVDRHTLPAGGADFFRAWLLTRRRNRPVIPAALPAGATLLLSGTATSAAPLIARLPGAALFFHAARPPALALVRRRLQRQGFASVVTGPVLARNLRTSSAITRAFARLARQLHDAQEFRHLLIAGGATAAAVLHTLHWSRLEVVQVWGAGVVTLQPAGAPGFTVTLKPGSYEWPDRLWTALAVVPHIS